MTFVALAERSELKDGIVKRHRGNGVDVLLVQSEGRVYVIENRCPHDGSPLVKGRVGAGCIRCPKHRIVFDLASGVAQGGEVTAGISLLNRYVPVFHDDLIGIRLAN